MIHKKREHLDCAGVCEWDVNCWFKGKREYVACDYEVNCWLRHLDILKK